MLIDRLAKESPTTAILFPIVLVSLNPDLVDALLLSRLPFHLLTVHIQVLCDSVLRKVLTVQFNDVGAPVQSTALNVV